MKLVPANAPYFNGAKLLIAADCTAYAYANMHEEFMKGKITIIGCPKLDSADYSEKLTQISAGIVDPTKVTRSALENAASVAAMVLTTESLVADIKEETPAAPAAPAGGMY